MKSQVFEFSGLRKNKTKDTITITAASLRLAEQEAKKVLTKITQTIRKPDVETQAA
ncbi:MAG: hypothetical protein RSG77_26725 [Hafnia sp.]